MKIQLTLIFAFATSMVFAQGVTFGDQSTIWVGGQASIYVGGKTTFNGTLTNNGQIISESNSNFEENNLDFVDNTDVGSLKFVGEGDQNLSGGTLNVEDIEVDKTGDVLLQTEQVVVSGTLDVTMGVIQAEEELDLLVTGGSDNTGQGYVDGKLVGLTAGNDVTFPMGVNGAPNYITLSNTTDGTIIRVECDVPDPTILKPDIEIQEVSDEVEWIVTAIQGTTNANLTINFSGVDLTQSTYGEDIPADLYEPAILVLNPGDSIFRILESFEIRDVTNTSVGGKSFPVSGTILTDGMISIGEEAVRLAIAYIPVVDDIEYFVPNSFAPNGTFEANRVFRPFFSGDIITSFTMRVFNSFNDEVYSISTSSDDVDLEVLGWNGRLPSGVDAPGGVYYYTLDLISLTDRRQSTGTVLLVE